MPATSVASSPCASRQSGAALILAILTVALVAGLAAAVTSDYGAAVESLSGHHDQVEARLLARGAVDWARNVLAESKRTGPGYDYAGQPWATRVPPTPVEEGEVAGEIQDLSGRFDLNALIDKGTANPDQVAAYLVLLEEIGIAPNTAQDLTEALLAWIGAVPATARQGESAWYAMQVPPRQPPFAPLVDVDELALVRGYDANLIAQLRPFVTALPFTAPLNVNTASAEVLAAMLPGLSLSAARIITAQQMSAPFQDIGHFKARLNNSSINVDATRFTVKSRYFLASGRAHFGEATTRMQVMLDRDGNNNNWSSIVWQKIL
jgi:general secretion pathway protein K